jgi:hypothetical protein
MVLSEHTQVWMQQRGLPRWVVDWLAAYGEVDHQRGAEVFYFTRRSRKALERDFGRRQVRRYAKALDAYMVCAEGRIATVGHRHRRIVRH